MKKSLLTLIPALAFVALTMGSCGEQCCTHPITEDKVCKDDVTILPGVSGWSAYKKSLEADGYNCN